MLTGFFQEVRIGIGIAIALRGDNGMTIIETQMMEVFDLRNTILPFALLEISNAWKHLAPGHELEIIGLDEVGLANLKRIIPESESLISEAAEFAHERSSTRIRIAKPLG